MALIEFTGTIPERMVKRKEERLGRRMTQPEIDRWTGSIRKRGEKRARFHKGDRVYVVYAGGPVVKTSLFPNGRYANLHHRCLHGLVTVAEVCQNWDGMWWYSFEEVEVEDHPEGRVFSNLSDALPFFQRQVAQYKGREIEVRKPEFEGATA